MNENREWIDHIEQEGIREHVVWWDDRGKHCSVPNCRLNKKRRKSQKETVMMDIDLINIYKMLDGNHR